jgi:hypothetical protein
MQTYDLAISYNWTFDHEFVELIEQILQEDGLKTFVITKQNFREVIELLRRKKIFFKTYLDRASDEDPEFEQITTILLRRKSYLINPFSKVRCAIDKAIMHKKLTKKRFLLPKTLILPAYNSKLHISIKEEQLDIIGRPFVIKPVLFSGGGQGVIKNAMTIAEIQEERSKNISERYLVQEKILPSNINGKRAWFRIFWAFGHAIPTWWNDNTHIYLRIAKNDIEEFNLRPLVKITTRLAQITNLDYFSTEIAVTKDHKFVLIDYINDQCDMRLKSNHPDGIPDRVVIDFIERMEKKILAL